MSEEQAAFQKATRDLISKRFQENEEQIKALKWDVAPSKILAHAATEPSQLLHELPREQLEQVLLDSDDIAARLKALNALPVELVDLGDGLDRGFSGFPGLRKEKSEGARERRANLEERLKNLPHVQMMNDMMKALGKFKVDNVETIIHSGMTPEEVHEAINRAMSSDGGAGGGSSTVRPKSGTLTMAALEEKLRGMTEKQLQDIIANIPRETTIDKIESLPQDQIDKFITRAMLQDALGSLNRNQVTLISA